MGHTHTPEIINEDIDNKKIIYANSGDWVQHSSYLILENGKIYLKYI
jgi:UDP-2,3-diacylglucosamine pyrophosphatase LpxH